MKTSFSLAAAVITCLLTATVRAASLPAIEDTTSFRKTLTKAAAKSTVLKIDKDRLALIAFDLSELRITTASQIRYARLRIYFPQVNKAGGGLNIHMVTGAWDEASPGDEPTYNSAPVASIPAAALASKHFASVDVTEAVQSWIADPAGDEGFAIVGADAITKLTIGAKEGSGSGYLAELEVELADTPLAAGSIGSTLLAPNLTLGGTTTVSNTGTGTGLSISLFNPSNGARGIDVLQAGSGTGVFSISNGGQGIWGITQNSSSAGVLGDNTGGGEAVAGRTGNANDANADGNGVAAVVGRNDLRNGVGVKGFVTKTGGIGVLGQVGGSGTGNGGRFENVNASNTSDVLVVASNSTSNLAVFKRNNGNVARIDANGKGFFNAGTQTGGADVAERIPSSGPQPQPGDVVEIDPDQPLHYRLSSAAGSPLVAGVITTRPGVLMNETEDDESDSPALALAGRVPVKIVNEGGPIHPGDLLVASSTPGHAMRAPAEVKPGTVIGKALEPFDEGRGVIEMLVMTR